MGYSTPDVYYQPEKFDLTIVGEIEQEPCYSFDKLVVWQHADGRLFYADDHGCSCPSPFENYTSLESPGEPITPQTWDAFEEYVMDFGYDGDPPLADKNELINEVRGRVRAQERVSLPA